MKWIVPFREVGLSEVALVGGKNASLGQRLRELSPLGIRVPDGFAVTADACRAFLRHAGLEAPIADLLAGVDRGDAAELGARAARTSHEV